jgi:hypothetical protein
VTVAASETSQLDHKVVGDITGRFLVPEYQRGYRWGPHEVRALLDDIWGNGPKNYSLQPVVVMKGAAGDFELVDGQQRLTTLFLVFLYVQRHHLPSATPPYTLYYRTRPETEAYLQSLDQDRRTENADFFHIYRAWEVINAWFAARAVAEGGAHKATYVAVKIHSYLNEHVRVIWYESQDLDPRALFARLNIGRIPLTSAELVKACLLARSGRDARAIERAAQWDSIEQDLRVPSFWAFLTNASGERYPTRIELLLDLLAGRPAGRDWRRYQTFDELRPRIDVGVEEFWAEVLDLHARLREWYDDHHRYHWVGYLIATGESRELAELVSMANGARRSQLEEKLVARIRARLRLARGDLRSLSYRDRDRCSDVLLLANVETSRTHGDERYPFHTHKSVRAGWSLEHIHAQQSEGLDSKEDWVSWLDQHVAALGMLPPSGAEAPDGREDVRERIAKATDGLTRDTFRALAAEVIALFTPGGEGSDWVHGLSNLALLPGEANTALGNSVFAVKRRRILDLDNEGTYVPPSTRRVFLKYYSVEAAPQLQFWTAADRKAYEDAIERLLAPYLTEVNS